MQKKKTMVSGAAGELMGRRSEEEERRRRQRVPDIALHLDLIEAELRNVRRRRATMLSERQGVEELGRALKAELARLAALNEGLRRDVDERREQLDALQHAKRRLDDEHAGLQLELDERRRRLRLKQQQFEQLREAEAKLDERLRSRSLQEKGAELRKHELEFEKLESALAGVKEKLRQKQTEVEELQTELCDRTKAEEEMQMSLSECNQRNAGLKSLLERLVEEEERLKERVAAVRATLEERRALAVEQETALAEVRTRVNASAGEKTRLDAELPGLVETVRSLEQLFKDGEKKKDKMTTELRRLDPVLANLRRKKAALDKDKETLGSENISMDKRIAELRVVLAKKNEERSKMQTRVSDVIRDCSKMRAEEKEQLEEHKKRASAAKAERDKQLASLQRVELESEKLREKLRCATVEKQQLQSQFESAQAEIQKLSKEEVATAREKIRGLETELFEAEEKRLGLEQELKLSRERNLSLKQSLVQITIPIEQVESKDKTEPEVGAAPKAKLSKKKKGCFSRQKNQN